MVEISTLVTKENSKADILAIPGVTGIGVGSGSGDYINIYVKQITSEITERLPKSLDGLPTRIIEVGEIMALQRKSKMRPAQPGCSIGNINISAGTFGCVAKDNFTGRRGILSNAHVLVSTPMYATQPNSTVVQPGPADGGMLADRIGTTVKWIPLIPTSVPGGINIVDCAFAVPDNDADISDDIIDLGAPRGVSSAVQNMTVVKSGRTSGTNSGTVLDIHASIQVGYGEFSANFDDILICSHIGDPGDSGSIVMDTNGNVIGLLFAGSENVTCVIKISNVLSRLNVSIAGTGVGGGIAQAGLGLLVIPMIIGGLYYWIRGKK